MVHAMACNGLLTPPAKVTKSVTPPPSPEFFCHFSVIIDF